MFFIHVPMSWFAGWESLKKMNTYNTFITAVEQQEARFHFIN